MQRPTVNETLMRNAYAWAARGTCSRLQVGAVLARDGRSLASGYNGVPAGVDHCTHDPASRSGCDQAVHAEENVLLFAARWGVTTQHATMYTTHNPCPRCVRMIVTAGVSRVVYSEIYRDVTGLDLLRACGVEIEQLYIPAIRK